MILTGIGLISLFERRVRLQDFGVRTRALGAEPIALERARVSIVPRARRAGSRANSSSWRRGPVGAQHDEPDTAAGQRSLMHDDPRGLAGVVPQFESTASWYRLGTDCPSDISTLCPGGDVGDAGTLRDASTPTATRLGAERLLVRIRSPRSRRAGLGPLASLP